LQLVALVCDSFLMGEIQLVEKKLDFFRVLEVWIVAVMG